VSPPSPFPAGAGAEGRKSSGAEYADNIGESEACATGSAGRGA
jgi:hypothetical protein